MKKIFLFVIFLFNIKQIIQTVSLENNKIEEKSCSRKNSKYIREYFARALLPIYKKYELPIPQDCEYSPLNDVYYHQENNKTRIEQTKWKCELCGKIFLTEHYLDRHFTHKHNDSLYRAPNGSIICLADLCPLFRCDINSKKKNTCDENQMKKLKERCDIMLDTCIPKNINSEIQKKLTSELNDKLCLFLDCSKYEEMPGFMTEGPNFLSILIIVSLIGISLIAYAVLTHKDLIFEDKQPTRSAIEELVDINKINNTENSKNHPIGILNNSSKMGTTNEIRQRKTVTFKD